MNKNTRAPNLERIRSCIIGAGPDGPEAFACEPDSESTIRIFALPGQPQPPLLTSFKIGGRKHHIISLRLISCYRRQRTYVATIASEGQETRQNIA